MKNFLHLLLLSSFSFLLLLPAASAQIAPHVVRARIAGIDLVAYPTGVKDVVTLEGALPAGRVFGPEDRPALATLTAMLLDKGTAAHDQFAIAAQLEAVGASISFGAATCTVAIEAKCLKKDLPLVVGLIAEQLRTPAFGAEEFAKAKKQLAGNLQRQLEDTGFRAGDAFTRAIYPVGHPNRNAPPQEILASLAATTLDEVKKFHAAHYGPAHFVLVAVGDVEPAALQRETAAAFAGWTGGTPPPPAPRATATDTAREQVVFVPEKTSVNIVLGQASGLMSREADYPALQLATAALGHGFSSRLVGQVRDTEGLTYGIGAGLAKDTFSDGQWTISATFAPDLLEKGIASTKRELAKWCAAGLTPAELAARKTNLVGEFRLGLVTTEGLAGALLNAIQSGRDVAWLDEYPKQIESLTLAQVNGAIKKYISPEKLILVKAGTVQR